MSTESVSCCNNNLDEFSQLLQTVAESHRLKIICLLRQQSHCVCELQLLLDKPHNVILHHLKILGQKGFLHKRKDGKHTYYELNHAHYDHFNQQLHQIFYSPSSTQ